MTILRLGAFCFFTFIFASASYSQTEKAQRNLFKDSTSAFVEISGLAGSTSRTPFWIQANQFGIIPRTSPSGSVRAQIEKYYPLNLKGTWRLGFGIDAVANGAQQSKFLLPQIHATLRFKNWEFFVGRKQQWIGLADSTLGTGSYVWSGNALPTQRIQFGTSRFVAVPFTRGWISFNGFYSEGLFDNNRPVTSDLKLHQKMFYVRIGRASSILKLYGGVNHQVEWGGKSPYFTIDGKMPNGIQNYLKLITGRFGDASAVISDFDNRNRVGNHLGTIDMAMEIESYEHSWFIYRQNIYEDGSLYAFANIKDGLNGVRFRRKNSYGSNFEIKEVVLEFLFTKSQGGPKNDLADTTLARGSLGKDDYFNNAQVRDGWSNHDRTIGTPFITPTSDTNWKWPNYANFYTSNNRVSVFHLGLKGTFYQQFFWTSKLSYSSNMGTYDERFKGSPTQFSGLLTVQRNIDALGGMTVSAALAADIGDLYPKNYGFRLGLRKDFSF